MTIEVGLWIIPTLITVISILAAWFLVPESDTSGRCPDFASLFYFGLNMIVALIISLLSWIIYAIFFGAG